MVMLQKNKSLRNKSKGSDTKNEKVVLYILVYKHIYYIFNIQILLIINL